MFNKFIPIQSFMDDKEVGGNKVSEDLNEDTGSRIRRQRRTERPSLVDRINDWFDLGKGLFWVLGGIVAATLIYANNNNTIQALREANNTRVDEIKDLRTEMNNRFAQQDAINASTNSKFDQIIGKQNEQLVILTQLKTQLDDNSYQGVSSNHRAGDQR